MTVELWPSSSETTFIGTPAARARLADVWRRSCSLIGGRPAPRAMRWKVSVATSGCRPRSVYVGEDEARVLPRVPHRLSFALLLGTPLAQDVHRVGVQRDGTSAAGGLGLADLGLPAELHDLLPDA